MKPKNGFTLIELLVVVTIIVVLLALLVPAMDKAIYQAEMAVCGTNMKTVANAAITYASGSKRRYPHRGADSTWDPLQIKSGTAVNLPRLMEPYLSYKSFIDPFLAEANLDWDAADRDPFGVYMPGYFVFLDWGHTATAVTRMQRLGQKMTFRAPAPEGDTRRFGVIISDCDSSMQPNWDTSSHPDRDGTMRLWTHHGQGNPWLANTPVAAGNVHIARWLVESARRGKVDNNYGLDDGSVLRLNDVPVVDNTTTDPALNDPRITFLPETGDIAEYNNGRRIQLPRMN